MGPLFSAMLLALLAGAGFALLFPAGWIFLPARRAALLAIVAILAGGAGAVLGAIAAAAVLGGPATLHARSDVLFLLASMGGGGVLCATLAGWVFLSLRRRSLTGPGHLLRPDARP